MAGRIRAELEPIYGWGWTGDSRTGDPIRETPAPFGVELDAPLPGPCTGIVVTEGHEFLGMTVDLARRHEEWEGTLNVPCFATAASSRKAGRSPMERILQGGAWRDWFRR